MSAAFCLPMIQCVYESLSSCKQSNKRKLNSDVINIQLNTSDKDPLCTIFPDCTTCEVNSEKQWAGVRASHGVKTGRYYFEVTVLGDGLARIGCSTLAAHLEIGKDSYGFGYGGTGMISHAGKFESYGVKFSKDSVVGCYIDLTDKIISYSVDGKDLGKAFDIPKNLASSSILFPTILLKNCKVQTNFGASSFKYSIKTNFTGLSNCQNQEDLASSNDSECFISSNGIRKPLSLIIEPSIELAQQV